MRHIVHLPAAQPPVPPIAKYTFKHHLVERFAMSIEKMQWRVNTHRVETMFIALGDTGQIGQL
ncbi:hypothetical protein D3C87_1713440 [compost metagenome]